MFESARVFAARIVGWFAGRKLEQDFDEEVESHLAMLADEHIRKGMTPEQARQAARRSFGGITQIKEDQRERRGLPRLEILFKDVRYAARMLRKTPGFTFVAILTLALGIGVNTTLFTAFNAVALKTLPVKNPDHLVRLERWFESGAQGDNQYAFSYAEYVYFRDHTRGFSNLIAATWPVRVSFAASNGEPEMAHGQLVSSNYFADLGIDAALGRTFLPEESQTPGAHPVAVLSNPYWQRAFHSDPRVCGRIVKLNDISFTVVGVAPEEFAGTGIPPNIPDFWAPLMMQPQLDANRNALNDPLVPYVQILGRLNAVQKRAQAEIDVLERQFAEMHKPRDRTLAITLQPARFFGNTEDPRFQAFVAVIMGVVGLVLLIACANLANMLLARSAARQRELSVRLALGASRGRLIGQLLTESTLLALLGGFAGLLLSVWATKVLWVFIQEGLIGPFAWGPAIVVRLSPDVRVFSYTLCLSLATGIVFGLSPALRFTRSDLTSALKDEGTTFGQHLSRSRLRSFLVAGQVTVSLVLLIAAGLLVRGLVRSQNVDPGFETRTVYLVSVDYGSDTAKAIALQRRVIDRLGSLPEVRAVTMTDHLPMFGTWTPPVETGGQSIRTLANRVAPEYFETLGIALERGRVFTRQEMDRGAPVAVISAAAARQLWNGQNALGRRLKLDMDFREKWAEFEVVGIAHDVRSAHLSRIDPMFVYLPLPPGRVNNVLIRTEGDPKRALAAVRSALGSVDKSFTSSVIMFSLESLPLRLEKTMARVSAMCAIALAVLALALAAVGIYGVMSYLVSQRVKEIGISMALGASASNVLKSVILQGMRPVLAGSVCGLALAAGVSSLLHSTLSFPGTPDMLFGVSMLDPLTFIGLTLLLAIIAMLASAIPAWRAVKVDPMVALRVG
jgi:predicted permease